VRREEKRREEDKITNNFSLLFTYTPTSLLFSSPLTPSHTLSHLLTTIPTMRADIKHTQTNTNMPKKRILKFYFNALPFSNEPTKLKLIIIKLII
jgi:hypothetical protein